MTVPAPGQDNPQERARALLAVPFGPDTHWEDEARTVIAALSAALEAATRERDAAIEGREIDRRILNGLREAAERERDYAIKEHDGHYLRKATKATARAEAVERECDRWRAIACNIKDEKDRAEAAERALEAARDALRFYANPASWEESSEPDPRYFATGKIAVNDDEGEIARRALDASASTEGET